MQWKETSLIDNNLTKYFDRKSDKFRTRTLDGDVNFSGQTEMNSKTQTHKSVLFMYINVK